MTSIVTAVTEYLDTHVTHYITNVGSTTTLVTASHDIATNRLVNDNLATFGPATSIVELNGTTTSLWGRILTSPSPCYIYPTFKAIQVPAITQENGQLACVTSVTDCRCSFSWVSGAGCDTYTSWNSNAQKYFQSYPYEYTLTNLPPKQPLSTIIATSTTMYTTVLELVLLTPFIYSPDWGKPPVYGPTENDTDFPKADDEGPTNENYRHNGSSILWDYFDHRHNGSFIFQDYAYEDYGYVPRALIDIITELPEIASHFPSGASILPGGPSMVTPCVEVLASEEVLAEDLTVSTAVTITSAGCFHPGDCPVQDDGSRKTTSSNPIGDFTQSPATVTWLTLQATKTVFLPGTSKNFKMGSSVSSASAVSAVSASAFETAGRSFVSAKPIDSMSGVLVTTPSSNLLSKNARKQALSDSQVLTDPVLHSPEHAGLERETFKIFSSAIKTSASEGAVSVETSRADHLFSASPEIAVTSSVLSEKIAPEFKVGSQRVMPSSGAVSVSLNKYSHDFSVSAVALNSITRALSRSEIPQPGFAPVLSIGFDRLTAKAASGYIIDGQVLSPAGKPITVSGTTYSLAAQASAVVVNGVANTLPTYQDTSADPTPILSIGSLQFTVDAASRYILDSKTLSPGGNPIVVSGTTYRLGPQPSALDVHGLMSDLSGNQDTKLSPGPVIKIGSQYLAPDTALRYIAGSRTLIPGATPIVVSGTTYSLASQASAVVMNGITSVLSEISEAPLVSRIKIGSQDRTLDRPLEYTLGGKILIPGATPIIVFGTTYSLGSHASVLVVNGVTTTLETRKSISTNIPKSASDSHHLEYFVGSQTLSPGAPATTISGVPISLAAAGDSIAINSSQLPIQSRTAFPTTIASQIISATAVSRSTAGGQLSTFETARVLNYSASAPTVTPTFDAVISSNTLRSSIVTSGTNALENGNSNFTGEASRIDLILITQILVVVLLGVVGLTLL